jgi:hypothetical protein
LYVDVRQQIIKKITTDANFITICKKVNPSNYQDIYQEGCIHILETDKSKLPTIETLNFYWYRLIFQMSSKTGQFRKKYVQTQELTQKHLLDKHQPNNEHTNEVKIREAEKWMLSLSEFENRVVRLYIEYGDMKKVQRATGISYSALRSVKEKIKNKK